MFDDLDDAALEALRVQVRTSYQRLAEGKQVAEIRYGETGRKFHPADIKAVESFLAKILAEQKRRAGETPGGFTLLH